MKKTAFWQKQKRLILSFMFFLLAIFLAPKEEAYGLSLLVGSGIIDQGDDVTRPGLTFEMVMRSRLVISSYLYGRKFGPVDEKAYGLSIGSRKKIFGPLPLRARFGLTMLNETTTINNTALNETENNYNVGGYLGASYGIKRGPFLFKVIWDSHLYPAGLNGFILLATGRKHVLSFMVGARL